MAHRIGAALAYLLAGVCLLLLVWAVLTYSQPRELWYRPLPTPYGQPALGR